MMRKLPPLNALKAFEATARLSSVTKAAAELSVSHSSISQHIKQLEEYFGQKLFDRQGRGLSPTSSAAAYLEDLRTCFDRIAVASERLVQVGDRSGLTINATPSFAMRWLIPKTSLFQIMHPSLSIKVTTSLSDEIVHLNQPYDFIIRREHMTRQGYVCKRFLDDRSTPVMAPALYERLKPEKPSDLMKYNLLHMRSRPQAWKHWFGDRGVAVEDTIGGAFFDHFFLSLQAAISGMGVAIGPFAFIEDDLRDGRLMVPFPHFTLDGPGFHILYSPEFAERGAGKLFMEWLEAETGSLPG